MAVDLSYMIFCCETAPTVDAFKWWLYVSVFIFCAFSVLKTINNVKTGRLCLVAEQARGYEKIYASIGRGKGMEAFS
jgi:hypothetical protein